MSRKVSAIQSKLHSIMDPARYIKRGQPDDAGFAMFESESLKWPGFLEFDDVNGSVLTFSAQDSIYKVFDLKNYTMLYSTSNKNVQEIKMRTYVAIVGADHCVIAADTRMSTGYHILTRDCSV